MDDELLQRYLDGKATNLRSMCSAIRRSSKSKSVSLLAPLLLTADINLCVVQCARSPTYRVPEKGQINPIGQPNAGRFH